MLGILQPVSCFTYSNYAQEILNERPWYREYATYETSIADWISILSLADRWGFEKIKNLAALELGKKQELQIVSKIALYQKYHVHKQFIEPLHTLLSERDDPLNLDEAQTLGMEAAIHISTARELFHAGPFDGIRKSPPKVMKEGNTYLLPQPVTDETEGNFKRDSPPTESGQELVYVLSLFLKI